MEVAPSQMEVVPSKMEVASSKIEVSPFFVDFHDLRTFVAIYALFPQNFFGQNSLLRNITCFLHVWSDPASESIAAESAKYSSLAVIIMVNTPTASNF